ncbi:MAG: RidA family protein [Dehalococcoidia bacterium]|nr:RidA family protein [Dehalococcoidia bacterium]
MTAEARLQELAIALPEPPAPVGLYAPVKQSGNLLYVSGQLPTIGGLLPRAGRLGEGVSVEEAQDLARQCAINALALVRQHLGSLDRVAQVVRVGGFVASGDGFTEQPKVVNGASQLLIDIFGDAGRHARAAVGVAQLPAGAPVEVEFLFEVAP